MYREVKQAIGDEQPKGLLISGGHRISSRDR